MKMYFGLILLTVVTATFVNAEPQVVGYQRFHSESPTKQGGAVLYSELGCANCHGGDTAEIPRTGPALVNLSNRVNHQWLVKFLKDPQSAHQGSNMPAMVDGLSDEDITAIIAYLGKVGTQKKLRAGRHANAERGSALYHERGCITCHAPSSDYLGVHGNNELAIHYPALTEKYSLTSLDYFLTNTSLIRTDGRMPHFNLTREDSADLAAHLFDYQHSDPRQSPEIAPWPKATKAELARGQTLVKQLNCAACHKLPGIPPLEPIAISNFNESCLSASQKPGIPAYQLTKAQRDSLVTFLGSDRNKAAYHDLTFTAMNCYACHNRGNKGGPTELTDSFFIGNESLGDSGRLPPPLTDIGHKLQTDWMVGVFQGKPETQVRPYLKTQMPKYPRHANALATWLAKIDHKTDAQPLEINSHHIADGKKLLGINGGVNCITCHHWADKKSLGIPGPNLGELDKRLRPSWFREYLLNPAGYRPGTLMPPLWPEGQSAIPDILDGDSEKQIAAIWTFIKQGEGTPEGFPDRSSGEFELIPTDRPIIQRTFLNKTGAKAILVGFPGQIHLAYDGLNGRPSLLWRGKFFDAYNTWFTRAAPFEDPLGDEIDEFSPTREKARFRGYRIDKEGNPTFILTKGETMIEEHFAVRDHRMIRTVTWDSGEAPVVSHPTKAKVEVSKSNQKRIFTYFWK